MIFFLIVLIYVIGIRIGAYKIFEKRGIPGWKAFVPIICSNEWQKLIDKPTWWTAMLFIPGVNLFYWSGQLTRMSTAHGRTSFLDHVFATLGAPIYWPWLAFNDKIKYISPTGLKSGQKVQPKGTVREWADALIFALVAAYLLRMFVFEAYTIPTPSMEKTLLVGDFLFVSKFHYGARIPQTPLALPLLHHSLPYSTTQSYLEWIKLPYMKLPALQKIKRYDMVVFNFPAGDTVALQNQEETYYNLVRWAEFSIRARDSSTDPYSLGIASYYLENVPPTVKDPYEAVKLRYNTEIKARPVDKRENYIKRCVAIPGDKLEMKEGTLYINDKKAYVPEHIYLPYQVTVQDNFNVGLSQLGDYEVEDCSNTYRIPPGHNMLMLRMTQETVEAFKKFSWVKDIRQATFPPGDPMEPVANIFPNDFRYYHWNVDNFGPITIPKKGIVLQLNDSTLCQYKRLIEIYEGNKLEKRDGKIFINGKETTEYTPKLDYYWMMGDNRSNSADSRFWGFVPEDHIVGKAWFIWLSINYKADDFLHKIRWNRILTNIHNKWAPKSE